MHQSTLLAVVVALMASTVVAAPHAGRAGKVKAADCHKDEVKAREVSVVGNGFASTNENGNVQTAGDPAVAAQVQAAFANIPGFENFFPKREVSVSGNGFASTNENGNVQTAGDPAVAAQVQQQIQAAFGNIPGFENLFPKREVSVSGNGFASTNENGHVETAGDPAVAAQVQQQIQAAFGNIPGFENLFPKREVSVSGNGFAQTNENGKVETAGNPDIAAEVQKQIAAVQKQIQDAFANFPQIGDIFKNVGGAAGAAGGNGAAGSTGGNTATAGAAAKREVSVSGNGFASTNENGNVETAGDPAVAAEVQQQIQDAFAQFPGFFNKREVSVSGNGFASTNENGNVQTAGDPAVAAEVQKQIQAAFAQFPGFFNKREVSVSGNGFASTNENGHVETAGDPAVAAQVQQQLQAAFGNIPGFENFFKN